MKALAVGIAMVAAGVLLVVAIVAAIRSHIPSPYDDDDEVHP